MKTKGIKFLAVLAVLAMAFAAFAVMADTEQNSAAIPEEVTTVSTETDFRNAITGDEEFNVKLDADIQITSKTEGYLVQSAGVIDFNGHTLKVTVELEEVELAQKIDLGTSNDNGLKSIIVNESNGLTLKDTSKDGKGGIINAAAYNGESSYKMAVLFNAPNGVMTIESGSYSVDNGNIKSGVVDATKSYWYTVKNLGEMTINGGYFGGMNHYWANQTGEPNLKLSSVIVNGWWDVNSDWTTSTLVINGGIIEYGGYLKGDLNAETTINGGTIKNGLSRSFLNTDRTTVNSVVLEGGKTAFYNWTADTTGMDYAEGLLEINCDLTLNGVNKNFGETTINGKIKTAGENAEIMNSGVLTGTGSIESAGKLTVKTPGTDKFGLAGSLDLKILEGSKVPAKTAVVFQYVDEYNDTHSFSTSAELDVGMGDFTIAAGQNKLTVDGTVTLTAATTYTCEGNVTLSGMVYKDADSTATAGSADLTLVNETKDRSNNAAPADIKLGTFQVTDGGSVALSTSVLVEAGCSFYVSGALTVGATGDGASDAILKIAEGAVVKPEGTLTLNGKSAIWNAGKFIATGYGTSGSYDTKLIRVFMNTGYQTGTFYLGSSVYDGFAAETGQIPLTVAFGSYIDMTGIDKVNLTSGGIDVNSALYKYKTLILATYDNTIALTATYDNQYPVTVTLDGKSAATPVMTAKSATINNVVWQSPVSATLYVTAPEVYIVELAKEIDESTPASSTAFWTSDDLTIKDQNGRAIPIAADGTIKVVFGYQYTIEGANSTSNYKFYSPNGELTDLTKVDKTKGMFTMIRDNLTPDTPVVLYITEGFATTLTVTLEDSDKQYAVGDVFMYYAVADEKGNAIGDGTPVTVELDEDDQKVGIIKDVYSNDTILFKSEFVKFYKSTALKANKVNIIFPGEVVGDSTVTPAVPAVEAKDTLVPSEEWTEGFTFVGPSGTDKSVKASFTLQCALNKVDVTFTFGQYDSTKDPKYVDGDQRITVEFTTYCTKSGHSDSVSKKLSDTLPATENDQTATPGQFKITMVVGEVYKISWAEINGYLSEMTYNKTSAVVADTDKVYTQETPVTVAETLFYTLSEEKLNYITVENQTSYDLTISIGQFSADIPARQSNNEVIANEGAENPAILSKKGYTIDDWKFQTKMGDVTDPVVYVSGPMTVMDLIASTDERTDGYFKPIPTDGSAYSYTLIIKETHVKIITYTVDVEADDHATITNYDNSGQLGQPRKAYVQPYAEYTVIGVEYEYQEVGMTEKAVGQAVKKISETTGQEYWEYIMPASNVVLKPISQKETRNLSFVDENGELIEDATKVEPTTQVNMPVPCKPLSEIVSVTTESQIDYEYDPVTGYISFEMPDEDIVFVVTCVEIEYSDDVTIFLEKAQGGVKVTLLANDGVCIQAGSVEFTYYYAYELNGKWATGFKTYTAQTGEIDDKVLFQFTVDLSEQERFAETMWIEGTYTSSDEAVNAASELIVYQ